MNTDQVVNDMRTRIDRELRHQGLRPMAEMSKDDRNLGKYERAYESMLSRMMKSFCFMVRHMKTGTETGISLYEWERCGLKGNQFRGPEVEIMDSPKASKPMVSMNIPEPKAAPAPAPIPQAPSEPVNFIPPAVQEIPKKVVIINKPKKKPGRK